VLTVDQYLRLLEGAWVTVQVTAYATLFGTALALVGGVSVLGPFRSVRIITRVYVEVFRGVSAIILLFWVFFAVPQLFDIQLTPMQAGVLALAVNLGAYGTEVVRGAIQAIPKGQTEASIAISLTGWQRLRHVILPQALVTMLPPYGNLLIEVLKASALVSLITLNDIMRIAQVMRNSRAAPSIDIFLAVLVIYFVLAQGIALTTRALERRFGRGVASAQPAKAMVK
jgi:polar amino acid transport system permease protein